MVASLLIKTPVQIGIGIGVIIVVSILAIIYIPKMKPDAVDAKPASAADIPS